MPDPESSVRWQPWRLALIVFVATNVLIVTAYVFHEGSVEAWVGLWPSGIVWAQITLLALWTSWATAAVWKRWALVAACWGLPMYVALIVEWWQGGALVEGMLRAEAAAAFLLLSLAAILMPVRWMTGCRLSFSREPRDVVSAGRFGLGQLFGLTWVVATALALLAANGGRTTEGSALIWPLIMLALLVSTVLVTIVACLGAVFSRTRTPVWLLALVVYLFLVGIGATELFCHLNRAFRDPQTLMDYGEVRGWMYQIYACFAATFVLSLLILRLMGMQLIGGPLAPNKGDKSQPIAA